VAHPSRPDYIDERFRLLVESLTDYAVFMIDPGGTMISWNPGVERVLGYTADEFVGRPFSTIFTPEDVAQGRPDQELARARESGRSDDKRDHVRKNGTRFRADGVVAVIRDDEGELRGFSKVMHDVTSQEQTSRALRESEARYRLLVESIKDYAIFLLDTGGHVESWTQAAERLTGYSADEIIAQHFRIFFSAEDQQRGTPEQELRTAVEMGRCEVEGWRIRKDGSRFWGDEVVSAVRTESGELRGFSKVVRDLTDRQRAALEREQLYTQAQEANRLKDEFLGTVSHELRTPLNAILGWANLLDLDAMDLNKERRRRALRTIKRNAEIQVQLVDDLLDVSRIISGRMRLQLRPTNLIEVLHASVESVEPAARARHVALHIGAAASPPIIVADPDRLQQIVWNLLSNAIKFTSPGGRVDIETREADGHTEIVVSDTGAGIAPGVLPFIFERFRQADSSTTRTHGGVGLGLAIVRHLAELHGGSVEAASAGVGRGARFTVRLPAAAIPERRSTAAGAPDGVTVVGHTLSLAGLRIVVVDDDADTLEVLTAILGKWGATVTAADSSARALGLVAQRLPDVIIADIGMPGEDGYAFIQQLRKRPPEEGAKVPAIALTAYARVEDRERALAAGYQLHVPKPFVPQTIVAAVSKLAGSHSSPLRD
jgi:PAS domain S-box-containing protein